jgi:ABC-type Fe3+-hydroxamate transport system substrate-binding protein
MILTDALGTVHRPIDPAEAPRIVSLVPSITELLCDLGLAQWLVGRTGFCVHPAATVRTIAKVGGTKDINIDKIIRLAPTHLIVNIDENPKPAVDTLAQHIPHVVVTHPLAPRDNLALYRLLGALFGCADAAEDLCSQFEAAIATCQTGAPQRVLYCIWQEPWMTVAGDTYIARMLAQIGWIQWAAPVPARYPVFDWDPAMLAQIDLILLSSEPYRFTPAHVETLARQTGKPVLLVDGEMVSWYGSRAIAGMRYLEQLRQQGLHLAPPQPAGGAAMVTSGD